MVINFIKSYLKKPANVFIDYILDRSAKHIQSLVFVLKGFTNRKVKANQQRGLCYVQPELFAGCCTKLKDVVYDLQKRRKIFWTSLTFNLALKGEQNLKGLQGE